MQMFLILMLDAWVRRGPDGQVTLHIQLFLLP